MAEQDVHGSYSSPLETRYASRRMAGLFSPRHRIETWRRLWVELARGQMQLGLGVKESQVAQLEEAVTDIDFDVAARAESELRHDVMAHIHAFGERVPEARGILHWGATSCFITDNADLVILREALELTARRLADTARALGSFAAEWRDLPTLGFTHLQPAQPTTVGKRASLWLQDVLMDLEEVERVAAWLPFRGVKGTTGTQASFLQLFDGDHAKVEELDTRVAAAFGFGATLPVSGQTYTRKIDWQIVSPLSGIAQTAGKFSSDVRLLAQRRELEEPFETSQVGSSAMPYKRNPMRSERMASLSRFLISLAPNAAHTAANQWLERTLDDSANRRMALSEAFLAADAILVLFQNVAGGLVVNPKVVERRLAEELPFLATEGALMMAVEAGGDRQDLHEKLRVHAIEAGKKLRAGEDSDLLERIRGDEAFAACEGNWDEILDPARLVGRAPDQVDAFLAQCLEPVLSRYPETGDEDGAQVRV